MSYPQRRMPGIGLNTTMNYFAGMGGDDTGLHHSPATSHLEYDDFTGIGDSMFPRLWDTQPYTQEMDHPNPLQTAHPRLNLNTGVQTPQSIAVNFQNNGDIGERFYDIQQSAAQGRNASITSPSIIVGPDTTSDSILPGQFGVRNFIHDSQHNIVLQFSDEIARTGLDVDLFHIVSNGYTVQRPPVGAPNMEGIVALRWGIAVLLCQASGRNAPADTTLLNYLHQQVSRIRDGTAPQVHDSGIDRPLLLAHLLMVIHQYGLRNKEQYNLGVIRPSSVEPVQSRTSATYDVTFEGPKTLDSKTIWLYEEAGAWYPLAPRGFTSATKSYADALKMPPVSQSRRPMTPSSSHTGLLVPGVSPSTQHTPSEAGSDVTGITSHSCRSCGKKFDGQSELAHHHRNHRHRTLVCAHRGCGHKFLYQKDLKRHEKTHTSKDTRMDFVCPVATCGKAYTRQDNLRRHQKQDHPNFVPPQPTGFIGSRGRHGARLGY